MEKHPKPRLDYNKLSAPASQAMFALEKAVKSLDIDPKILELVKIRASQMNGCLFCLDMHVKEARKQEERELRLYHLAVWRESPLFTAKEKAALEWCELLTHPDAHGVEDEDYEAALVEFSEAELSALTFAISTINAWNRLGIAFRTPLGFYDKLLGLDRVGLV